MKTLTPITKVAWYLGAYGITKHLQLFSRAFPTDSSKLHKAITDTYKNIEAVGFTGSKFSFVLSGIIADYSRGGLGWPLSVQTLDSYEIKQGWYVIIYLAVFIRKTLIRQSTAQFDTQINQ